MLSAYIKSEIFELCSFKASLEQSDKGDIIIPFGLNQLLLSIPAVHPSKSTKPERLDWTKELLPKKKTVVVAL